MSPEKPARKPNSGHREGKRALPSKCRTCAAHRVSRQNSAVRRKEVDCDQFSHKGFRAGFRSRRGKGSGRAAVARQVWNKHSQPLFRKTLTEIRHDFLIGGNAVKQQHRTPWRARQRLDDIDGHAAAGGIGNDSLAPVRSCQRQPEPEHTQHHASESAQFFSRFHRGSPLCKREPQRA